MTGPEFLSLKKEIGLSYAQIGKATGVTPRNCMRWSKVGVRGPAEKILLNLRRNENDN